MNKERLFIEWLRDNHIQITNPDKYSKLINTLTNHLNNYKLSQIDLLSLDNPETASKLRELYFSKTELFDKNVKGKGMYSRAFDLYIEFLNDNTESINLIRDIDSLTNNKELTQTERKNLIDSRIGQGKYRNSLIKLWNGCSVTGFKNVSLLIASHIKPWTCSDNKERLDVFNGFLLLPNIDKVFDKGLISFADNGSILISDVFENFEQFGISTSMKISLYDEHLIYLDFHRKNIFKTH